MKNKLILLTFLITTLTSLSYGMAEEIIINAIFPSEKAVIISGEKEAKQNVTTTFLYEENKIYNIYCRVNNVTAIMLNPDEQVVEVKGADTARWDMTASTTGSKDGQRNVLILKPLAYSDSKKIKTSLIVLTNKRYYTFNLLSAKEWYNPIVKFRYPEELQIKQFKQMTEEKLYLTDPSKLNYKYTVSTKRYDFVPSTIFDDGKKTFLVMKEELQEMPAFYIKEGKKLALVNFRKKGNYLIIDRLFQEGALQLGNKRVIIKNKNFGR